MPRHASRRTGPSASTTRIGPIRHASSVAGRCRRLAYRSASSSGPPLLVAPALDPDAVGPGQAGGHDGVVAEPVPDLRRPPRRRRPSGRSAASSKRQLAGGALRPGWLTLTPSSRTPAVGSTPSSSSLATRAIAGAESTGSATRDRAGDRAEVVEAHLEGDRPPGQAVRAQPGGHGVGHAHQLAVAACRGGGGRGRRSPRGRSTSAAGRARRRGRRSPLARRVEVAAVGVAERRARPRRRAGRRGRRRCARRAARAGLSVAGPTPHSASTGSGWRKASSSPGRIDHHTRGPARGPCSEARGLAASEAELGQELVARHADRARQALLVEDVGPDGVRRSRSPVPCSRRAPVTSRKASSSESGSTSGVNERKIVHHLAADLAVVMRGRRAGRPRAGTAAGPGRRHGRVDAVGPGLVGGGRHHAPVAGAADDHRLAAQLGAAQQLDRHEERVHVDVQDRRRRVVRVTVGATTRVTPERREVGARRPDSGSCGVPGHRSRATRSAARAPSGCAPASWSPQPSGGQRSRRRPRCRRGRRPRSSPRRSTRQVRLDPQRQPRSGASASTS